MIRTLMDAIERGEIDTQFEKIINAYTKEHRSILKSPGLVDKELPHSDTFYFDLFMSAFALVSQRKSPKEYQSHRSSLFSNQSKFLMLAVQANEEKKKHVGQSIDFDNKIVFAQNKLSAP
jgi:hypothetical protein